jgi:hypothetical protein
MDATLPDKTPERRRQSRTDCSQVVRVRPIDSRLSPDSGTTLNVSERGLYLSTVADHYAPGANVYLTSDFQSGNQIDYATEGIVVRVEKLKNQKWGVAIQIKAAKS